MFPPTLPVAGTRHCLLLTGEVSSSSLEMLSGEHCFSLPDHSKGCCGSSGKKKSVLGLSMYLSYALVKPELFLALSVTNEYLFLGRIVCSTLPGF